MNVVFCGFVYILIGQQTDIPLQINILGEIL